MNTAKPNHPKTSKPPTPALLRAVARRAGIYKKQHGQEWMTGIGCVGLLSSWRPWEFAAHAAPLVEMFGVSVAFSPTLGWGYCDPERFSVVTYHQGAYTYPAAAWTAAVAHHQRELALEKAAKSNKAKAGGKVKK